MPHWLKFYVLKLLGRLTWIDVPRVKPDYVKQSSPKCVSILLSFIVCLCSVTSITKPFKGLYPISVKAKLLNYRYCTLI